MSADEPTAKRQNPHTIIFLKFLAASSSTARPIANNIAALPHSSNSPAPQDDAAGNVHHVSGGDEKAHRIKKERHGVAGEYIAGEKKTPQHDAPRPLHRV